jgi:hypothetical protein
MIRIKDGVDLAGLAPEMVVALIVADQVYEQHNSTWDVTITSARDSRHSAGSKHYVGMALDLRTSAAGISASTAAAIAREMKEALGSQFDVIDEGDHIHVELDPKVGSL